MSPFSRGFDKLVGAGFVLVGFCAIAQGLTDLYRGYRSKSWASTSGVIVRSWVAADIGEGATYTPTVAYRYKVGGVEYESDRTGFGGSSRGCRLEAESWVDRHKAGVTVPVFYDPENPHAAVLERGVSTGAWLPLVIGTLFVPVGFYLRTGRFGSSAPQ